jgi:hypothetical protein
MAGINYLDLVVDKVPDAMRYLSTATGSAALRKAVSWDLTLRACEVPAGRCTFGLLPNRISLLSKQQSICWAGWSALSPTAAIARMLAEA